MKRKRKTMARSHGEPDSFEFRFSREPKTRDIQFDLVGFPTFESRKSADADRVLTLGPNEDAVCRAFCFALREFQAEVGAKKYRAVMSLPLPVEGIKELSELLGGEFDTPIEETAQHLYGLLSQ